MHNFLSPNRKARIWEGQKIQIKFIDSLSFMASSLSGFTVNLVGLHKGKCKDCKSSLKLLGSQRWFANIQVCGLQQNFRLIGQT